MRRRIAPILCAGLVCAAAPAPAAAQVIFGGSAGSNPFAVEFPLRLGAVPPAGEVGTVRVAVRLDCPGANPDLPFGGSLRIVAPSVTPGPQELTGSPVDPLGEFAASGVMAYRYGSADGSLRVQLEGRVAGPEAVGRLRVTAELTSPARQTCRRSNRWRAVSAPGRLYAGATQWGDPLVLRLNEKRDRVQRLRLVDRPACPGSIYDFYTYVYSRRPVIQGSFGAQDDYRFRDEGRRIAGRDVVAGTLDGDVATGSWSDAWTERAARRAVECSRAAAWSARTGTEADAPADVIGPPPRFSSPVTAALTGDGGEMVAADLDGDGAPDVATALWSAAAVVVSRGNGDGSFRPPVRYRVASRPTAITLADLGGDGRLEIITAGRRDEVSVLPNRGREGFGAPRTVRVGRDPWALAAADLDNDGHTDLVVAHLARNELSVLDGDGSGRLLSPRVLGTPDARDDAAGVAVAHLDADGALDVALAESKRIAIRLGNGQGGFGPARRFPAGSGDINNVVAADLNRDGRTDLVAVDPYGAGPMLARADGSYTDAWWIRASSDLSTALVADFTMDGRPDIATPADAGLAAVFPGRDDGSSQAPVALEWPIADGGAVADFNRDGRPDLAFHRPHPDGSSLKVFLNWTGAEGAPPCVPVDLVGFTLREAVEELGWDNCRLGRVRRVTVSRRRDGHVLSQQPPAGRVLATGSRIDLVVGRAAPRRSSTVVSARSAGRERHAPR